MNTAPTLSELEAAALQAIERFPARKEGWGLLGTVRLQQQNTAAALEALEKANAIDPKDLSTCYHLGVVHGIQDNFERSAQYFEEAFLLAEELGERGQFFHGAIQGWGRALTQMGQFTRAEALAYAHLAHKPPPPLFDDLIGQISNNNNRPASAKLLALYEYALQQASLPFDTISRYLFLLSHAEQNAEEVLKKTRTYTAHFPAYSLETTQSFSNLRHPTRPLRIGFVSGDFRAHPVSQYLHHIWRSINRSQFELFAYSSVPPNEEDEVSATLRLYAKKWIITHQKTNEQVEALIKQDKIDILIDLSGYSGDVRLELFAKRLAPVQVSWLGHPGSTGVPNVDYQIIGNTAGTLETLSPYFSEKIALVPSVLPRFEIITPAVAPPPALENHYITFGSFNRLAKISEATLNLWAQVLTSVRSARFLIGGIKTEDGQTWILNELTSRGISKDRIKLLPNYELKEYYAQHSQIDCLLDTFPFNGRTITLNALWMGVPTLTLAGQGLTQNMGAEILGNLGLSDWITRSPKAFVKRAIEISNDLEALSILRSSLRARMENAERMRPDVVADSLERAWRKMWELWCEGKAPESFVLTDIFVPPRMLKRPAVAMSAPPTRYRSHF